MTVKIASAAPAAGLETESRPGTAAGPDVEPDAQPARRGHSRVVQWVDVPADVARAPFTPPTDGMVATWR